MHFSSVLIFTDWLTYRLIFAIAFNVSLTVWAYKCPVRQIFCASCLQKYLLMKCGTRQFWHFETSLSILKSSFSPSHRIFSPKPLLFYKMSIKLPSKHCIYIFKPIKFGENTGKMSFAINKIEFHGKNSSFGPNAQKISLPVVISADVRHFDKCVWYLFLNTTNTKFWFRIYT